MPSLTDLAPLVRVVPLRGMDIEFQGISAMELAVLFDRFPELKKDMAKGFTADVLTKHGPHVIAAVIAHAQVIEGESSMDDAALRKQRLKIEKAAKSLSLGEQVDILKVVLETTFPSGVRPIVRELMALGIIPVEVAGPSSNGASADTSKAPDTKSESQSPTPSG